MTDDNELLELAGRGSIVLSAAEKQSGFDRVKWAEGLISQLPAQHDGRNSWLLNYGTGPESDEIRKILARGERYVGQAASKSLRIPVELDEAPPPQPSTDIAWERGLVGRSDGSVRIIEPVTPETVFRAGDRVRARRYSTGDGVARFSIGDWLSIRELDGRGRPILDNDPAGDAKGWASLWFDLIERAPQ